MFRRRESALLKDVRGVLRNNVEFVGVPRPRVPPEVCATDVEFVAVATQRRSDEIAWAEVGGRRRLQRSV